VGNDHLQIVWNENGRNYDANTIISKFNSAHIIITPLKSQLNGLYSINVKKKDYVKFCEPWIDGFVVNKELLPKLVRSAAIVLAQKCIKKID